MGKYTVAVVNHALQSGRFVGNFEKAHQAADYARREAARTRAFMEYRVCYGSPKDPGKDVPGWPVFKGEQ